MRRLRHLSPWLLAVLLLLGLARPAWAAVFCVATAEDLQNALTTAATNGQDDEVRIVQGAYEGNFVYGSTEARALAVLGGYTTGCASRTLIPINTVLTGELNGDTVLKLVANSVAAEFLVEGLTLRQGVASGLIGWVGPGGEVRVDNNVISDNTASNGGGVFLMAPTVTLNSNDIAGNTADSIGGGVYVVATTATLNHNAISGNTADSIGNSVYLSANSATLTHNSISGSLAGGAGASGVYLVATRTATLTYNEISGQVGVNGGGLQLYAATANLNHNKISGNSVFVRGGGVYLDATTATLTNNDISGNRAHEGGGGIWLQATTARLTNNNFIDNGTNWGGGGGLAVWLIESWRSVALFNNLFWQNNSYVSPGADLNILNTAASQVTLLSNNYNFAPNGCQFQTPVYVDPSNLNAANPLFVDAGTGDHHLQPGSPMIDAGYAGIPELPDFDIEGTPRFLGNAVDIGAYEFDDGSEPKAVLNLTLAGTGSGRVTSSPSGIDCGSDCFQVYDLDTLVTLTATPEANSAFVGWSGPEDCADGQVTMSTHLSCTATFNAVHQLTVTRMGTGDGLVTSTPSGINCGAACAAYFYQGELVTLTATPIAPSIFSVWSGACTGTATCQVTMDAAKTLTASFALKSYTVTATAGTGGTISPASRSVTHGDTTTFSITPGTGYSIGTVSGCGGSLSGDTYTTGPITAACTVNANFNPNNYTVTATAGAHGSIDPASRSVTHGATTTFTVTPETGYSASASGCGGSLVGNTYTTGPITAACAVTASFSLKTYTVTASAGLHGTISPASRTVAHGATTRFTVTPNAGYSANVTGCGGSLSGTTYTTGAITAACAVRALFVPQVTVVATDNLATEKGLTTGTYTFTRTGVTTSPLTVNFKVTGTATAGKDYKALGISVTFPAGKRQVTKVLVPLQDTLVEPDETIILTLQPSTLYAVGKPASAKIILRSDE